MVIVVTGPMQIDLAKGERGDACAYLLFRWNALQYSILLDIRPWQVERDWVTSHGKSHQPDHKELTTTFTPPPHLLLYLKTLWWMEKETSLYSHRWKFSDEIILFIFSDSNFVFAFCGGWTNPAGSFLPFVIDSNALNVNTLFFMIRWGLACAYGQTERRRAVRELRLETWRGRQEPAGNLGRAQRAAVDRGVGSRVTRASRSPTSSFQHANHGRLTHIHTALMSCQITFL